MVVEIKQTVLQRRGTGHLKSVGKGVPTVASKIGLSLTPHGLGLELTGESEFRMRRDS